jgi:hypothetical protein
MKYACAVAGSAIQLKIDFCIFVPILHGWKDMSSVSQTQTRVRNRANKHHDRAGVILWIFHPVDEVDTGYCARRNIE